MTRHSAKGVKLEDLDRERDGYLGNRKTILIVPHLLHPCLFRLSDRWTIMPEPKEAATGSALGSPVSEKEEKTG